MRRPGVLIGWLLLVGCAHSPPPQVAPAAAPLPAAAAAAPEPAPAATTPPAAAAKLPVSSVAVLPIHAKGQADHGLVEVLDDLLVSSVQSAAGPALRVVGKSDIDAMLGLQKTKDALGCDAVECAAELAGALGVDSIISATVGTLGEKYVLTLAWIDQKRAVVFARHSEQLGKAVEDFDKAIAVAVAKLLGLPAGGAATDADGRGASAAAPAGGPGSFRGFAGRAIHGRWEQRDGALYGSADGVDAHYLLDLGDVTDFVVDVDLEYVSGARGAAVGVGVRLDTELTHGYWFNLDFLQLYQLFACFPPANCRVMTRDWPKPNGEFKPSPLLGADKTHLRVEMTGARYAVYFNGELADSGTDRAWSHGVMFLGIQNGLGVRFSNLSFSRR